MKTLCIVLAITAFIASAFFFQQNAPVILNCIKNLGWLAPVLFLMLYCLATILLLPTMVLTLAGGALFGPVTGTILNLLGATCGAACAFCISRHLAFDWFVSRRSAKIDKLVSGVEQRGWQFVALLRLLPVIPFNLVNYGLGITRIKFTHYIVTTLIFLTPAEIVYTYCGHAGMGALTHMESFYNDTSVILLSGLALLLIIIKFIHYYRAKKMFNRPPLQSISWVEENKLEDDAH